MATIKEIAAKVNLSSATVSRALRNDDTLSIAPETKARILAAATELGYVRTAPPSATQPEGPDILIVHNHRTFRNQIDSSYYFAIRSGIEDMCARHKVKHTFVPIEDIHASAKAAEGVVLVGNYSKAQFDELIAAVKGAPIVVVGIVAYYKDRVDQVTHSNYESVRLALEYLFKNGHTKIGYLGIQEAPGTEQFGSRKDAFISIMKEKGEYRSQWLLESDHGADRVKQGHAMVHRLLETGDLPSALFCANDPIGLGAINALLEKGYRVPEDISLVAHDGSYPTQYSFPPLSTVDVHPYQLGAEGTKMLLERLEQVPKYARKLFLYPTLIERSSVKLIK